MNTMEFADGGLRVWTEGPVGWLELSRPERLNAVGQAMWAELPAAVRQLESVGGVRVVVVRGAGERAFASGADIAEFDVVRRDAATNQAFTSLVTAATSAIADSPLPFIAMIRGFCIGGGVVIATACDMRVCSDDSRFGVPAAKLGLAYELDNFKRLHDLVGPGMAIEMLATARQLSAAEALSARLVNRIASAADLGPVVEEMAQLIVANAPLTVTAAKLSSATARNPELASEAQRAIDLCFESQDFKEGRLAFREKRPARFVGQ